MRSNIILACAPIVIADLLTLCFTVLATKAERDFSLYIGQFFVRLHYVNFL